MLFVLRVTLALALASCFARTHGAQTVRILVHVPADTPTEANVFLAGSLASVGSFRPDGVALTRQADGAYVGELALEPGETLQFKLTQGSWETVEKNADGSERANRVLAVDAGTREVEVTVARWSGGSEQPVSMSPTVIGTLELHTIESQTLGAPRTIRVWLPPGYADHERERYGVLYMLDGQNCFDRATSAFGNEWEIDEALSKLIAAGSVAPVIVVGIDNGGARRINEYTFAADAKRGGGGGERFAKFLLTEVMPWVDATYRTERGPEHTFLGGSSLGGLCALEIARRNAKQFGGVIAMSPSLFWADDALLRDVEAGVGGLAGARVWIDMGAAENGPAPGVRDENRRLLEAARRLDASLEKGGVAHRLVIDDEHAGHNEGAWAARFPAAAEYVIGPAK